MKQIRNHVLAFCMAMLLVLTGLLPTGIVRAEEETDPVGFEGFRAELREDNKFYFTYDSYDGQTDIPEYARFYTYTIEAWVDGIQRYIVGDTTYNLYRWERDYPFPDNCSLSYLLRDSDETGDHTLVFKILVKDSDPDTRETIEICSAQTDEMNLHIAKIEKGETTLSVDNAPGRNEGWMEPNFCHTEMFMGNEYYPPSCSTSMTYTFTLDASDERTLVSRVGHEYVDAETSSDTLSIESHYVFTPIKAGSATVSFIFNVFGEEKTFEREITIYDQRLDVSIVDNTSPFPEVNLIAGFSREYELRAVLSRYNSETNSYELVEDVTGDTDFSVLNIESFSNGKDQSDKITFSFAKNVMTVKAAKDAGSGTYFYSIRAEGSGTIGYYHHRDNPATADWNQDIHVVNDITLFDVNDDYFFPLKGQTSTLDITASHYKDGKKTIVKDTQSIVVTDIQDLTVKNASNKTVKEGDELAASDLPLTLKAASNSAYLRVEKHLNGEYQGWMIFAPDMKARDCTVTLESTSLAYNGEKQEPKVIVKYHGQEITSDLYETTYKKNKAIGTAQVIVKIKNPSGNVITTITKTFKIVPKTPAISKIEPLSTGLKLTWKKVAGVTGYQIYRDGTKIATVEGDTTVTYSDKTAKTNNTKYTYKVYAYQTVDGKTYKSAASASMSAFFLKATTISKISPLSTGLKLTWKKVSGVTGYQVYRGDTKIATVKGDATVTYSDKEAKTNGTKYTYKVIAYKTVSGTTSKSVASANKSAYFLKKPTISSLTNKATTKMVVTWGKNAKATGYEIQYSTKSSFASPTTVKITKATTVTKTITKLTKNKTYYVRIRAYKGTSYSAWSAAKKIKITK